MPIGSLGVQLQHQEGTSVTGGHPGGSQQGVMERAIGRYLASGTCLAPLTGATHTAEVVPREADHLTIRLTAEAVSSDGGGGNRGPASKSRAC